MRRFPIGIGGLLVVAAVAAPILLKSSKKGARKLGEQLEKYGKRLQGDSGDASEAPEDSTAGADEPHKAKAQQAKATREADEYETVDKPTRRASEKGAAQTDSDEVEPKPRPRRKRKVDVD